MEGSECVSKFDRMLTEDNAADHLLSRYISQDQHIPVDESVISTLSLHTVCAEGNVELAKTLIARRADPNAKDRWGNEPLKYSILGGHTRLVKFLESCGALCSMKSKVDLNCTYCRCAAEGDIQAMKRLLAGKVSVDAVDYDCKSALQLAASHGQEDVVKLLIELGVNVKYQDNWSKTAMDHAIQGGYFGVQEILRRAGVSTFEVSSSPGSKRHRTADDEKGFGRTRSASTGNIIETFQLKSKEQSALNTAMRRNSCGNCASDAALLALSEMSSKTARYLTAKGATLDAHIRWGGENMLSASDESCGNKSTDSSGQMLGEFERRTSSGAGRDLGRRCCISFDSNGIRVLGRGEPEPEFGSEIIIKDWIASPRASSGDLKSEGGGAPGGPEQPRPWSASSIWPDHARGSSQETGDVGLVHEATSLRVEAAEEDGHLARMRFIFAHGADIMGPSRALPESYNGKESGCKSRGCEGKDSVPGADGPRKLTRTSSLVSRAHCRSRAHSL
jgi:hypothetical protein